MNTFTLRYTCEDGTSGTVTITSADLEHEISKRLRNKHEALATNSDGALVGAVWKEPGTNSKEPEVWKSFYNSDASEPAVHYLKIQ